MNKKEEFAYEAVIILSQSQWYKEMRSNRYHYATRFSKLVPVFFVQSFDKTKTSFIEGVDGNITVINPFFSNIKTFQSLFGILHQRKIDKVFFWIYSPLFLDALRNINLKFSAVYHSTEAYIGSDMLMINENPVLLSYIKKVRQTINFCNFAIGVSEGVSKGIREDPSIFSPVYTISNGCDFPFWNGFHIAQKVRENVAFYQGGIHRKLDFALLLLLIESNPDVLFWFCGETYFDFDDDKKLWKEIINKKNVKYWGKLNPDEVRDLSHHAKVGLIPFKKNDYLINKSFPLKAFEYLSAGLVVISTPIASLNEYAQFFNFAQDFDGFDRHLKAAMASNAPFTKEEIHVCRSQDYDNKFLELLTLIREKAVISNQNTIKKIKKNILLLYDVGSIHVNAVREHVNAFGYFSRHQVTFYNATSGNTINEVFLNSFDAIAVHYSVRISVPGHFSEDIVSKLSTYSGLKILFIQDEYDNLRSTYSYMKRINFNTIFTCVPKQYHDFVYPKELFPGLKFVNNLTGYLSYNLEHFRPINIKEKKIDVFYRGRKLPYFYGSLGLEKYEIGIKFSEQAKKESIDLILDLESDDEHRIYGEDWIAAISRSKTMLGTESGSNLFDFNGDLRQLIDNDLAKGFNYEYIFNKYVKEPEKKIKMNQISPKIFEAMSLKTVLILYEGAYSNIIEPYRHYIPLKKDFSNFNEVIEILKNDEKLQEIADTAYEEVVKNEKNSYEYFIKNSFDKTIDENTSIVRDYQTKNMADGNLYDNILYKLQKKKDEINFSRGFMVSTITSNESEMLRGGLLHPVKFFDRFKQWCQALFLSTFTYLPRSILKNLWQGIGLCKDYFEKSVRGLK